MISTIRLEEKVENTINEYNLLEEDDKVMVAVSGGKDSTSILYVLNDLGYDVTGLFIDLGIPCYSNENLKNLKNFCEEEDIPLRVVSLMEEFRSNLPELHKGIGEELTACALCGVLKRYLLNKKAREYGGSKLVTGHNLDDEAENILLNIYGGNLSISAGLGPKTGVTNSDLFVQRVKPLYFCSNEETREYSKVKGFNVIYEDCPLITHSFRNEIRGMIKELEEDKVDLKMNLVNNFLKILPGLKKEFNSDEGVNACSVCGEPSRKELCKVCKLLGK